METRASDRCKTRRLLAASVSLEFAVVLVLPALPIVLHRVVQSTASAGAWAPWALQKGRAVTAALAPRAAAVSQSALCTANCWRQTRAVHAASECREKSTSC
jgi:hypothetical protein